MNSERSTCEQALRAIVGLFPGAMAVESPEPAEGPWGRGAEGWRNWVMESLDRQFAEYRAAGGAASLPPDPEKAVRAEADCLRGRVLLQRIGERVLMFTLQGRSRRRVRHFATPYMAHAMRQAEAWFGAPARGWVLQFSPRKRTSNEVLP